MLWLLRRLLDDKTEQLRPLILRPIYTRQYIVMKSCIYLCTAKFKLTFWKIPEGCLYQHPEPPVSRY